ncbi:hypothetical protein D3C75_986100 [compost metagenome]
MVEPRALEDVQHVMHVELGQAMGQYRTGQVRMAMVMKVLACEHFVHVRVATRAQEIVQTTTVLVDAVMGQAVVGNRHQRS